MSTKIPEMSDVLIHLFGLASRLEGEGQYNLAKLSRAGADALCRRAAHQLDLPTGKSGLVSEIERAISNLSLLNVDAHLLNALKKGLVAVQDERLPLIDETPNPFVCRTCGAVTLAEVAEKCPTCGAWPATFQSFPPVYWLDALDPPAAMEKLRQTPLEVAALLEGLSEEMMTHQPVDKGWAIRNVVSHIRDAQGVLAYRLDLFLKGERPILESQAVFAWATDEKERPASTFEIFESYKNSRQATLDKLETIRLEDWWRSGWHEEFGNVTIKQQASYFALHEITHLPQLDKLHAQWTA
jgi:hypothetical protein